MDKQTFARALRQSYHESSAKLQLGDRQLVQQPGLQRHRQLHQLELASNKNKKLFPQKLWDLINDQRYSFCLRWSSDGQLVYLNRDQFEDSYLRTADNQFHTQKAISFVRQMNMYGFKKVDDCFYENDNFKRDSEHLLKNMIRKHSNKNPQQCLTSFDAYHAADANQTAVLAESLLQPASDTQTTHLSSSPSSSSSSSCSSSRSPPPLSMTTSKRYSNSVCLKGSQLFKLNNLGPSKQALATSTDDALHQAISSTGRLAHTDSYSGLSHCFNTDSTTSMSSQTATTTQVANKSLHSPQEPERFFNEESSLSSFVFDYCRESFEQQQQQQQQQHHHQQLYNNSTSASSNLTSSSSSSSAAATASQLLASQNLAQTDNNYFNLFYALLSTLGSNLYPNGNVQQDSPTCPPPQPQPQQHQHQQHQPPAQPQFAQSNSATMKREPAINHKSARLFKRSVDSILDINSQQVDHRNNNHPQTSNFPDRPRLFSAAKKTKFTSVHKVKSQLIPQSTGSTSDIHARSLVINAAKTKSASVDESVINEVARHTQRFVETLIDTALVIARHSYNSSQAADHINSVPENCCFSDDNSVSKNLQRAEVSVINMSDLNSAIKLLPSKLSRVCD